MPRTKESAAAFRKANREELRQEAHIYYWKNREAIAERAKQRRRTNPEKERAQRLKHRDRRLKETREWRKRNPDRYRSGILRWRGVNREKVLAMRRRNYQRHKDAYLARVNRRRYAPIIGTHTAKQWRARIEFFGWRCWMCGKSLTESTVTKDHVFPLSKGGTDWASNLRPACLFCNKSKHAKHPSEVRPPT